jgi:hypothetical protein
MKALLPLFILTFLSSASFAQTTYRLPNPDQSTQSEIISIGWYPNPVHVGEKISVDVNLRIESEMKTELVDALGKRVFELKSTYPAGESSLSLYTNNIAPGLYFIRVTTEQGFRSEKIIIE